MLGLFKKQKGIKDLKETDLQKLFNEAERMYNQLSTHRNEILISDCERLKKDEVEYGYDKAWNEFTKQGIENNQKVLNAVKEVRENIIRLIEREKHTSIENRYYIIRDWYDYTNTFLNWYAKLHFDDLSTPQGRENRRKWDEAERAKDIKLEEIAKRLEAKLALNSAT